MRLLCMQELKDKEWHKIDSEEKFKTPEEKKSEIGALFFFCSPHSQSANRLL